MTFQPPLSIKDYANTCKVFVFALTVRSETENDGGRNLDNNKKRWGNENESLNAQPFLPRGKYKHCRKKISRREKRKKRRVIHLCFLLYSFFFKRLQNLQHGHQWLHFTGQQVGYIAEYKKQKEDGYFSSDSFLAAFYAYRQNHKATSDGAAVRKITQKTQTNKQTNKSHI